MKIKQIDKSSFEITEEFFGLFVTNRYNVFIDYDKHFAQFPNYNPIYFKDDGKQLGIFTGISLQDKIEAFKRVNEWKG